MSAILVVIRIAMAMYLVSSVFIVTRLCLFANQEINIHYHYSHHFIGSVSTLRLVMAIIFLIMRPYCGSIVSDTNFSPNSVVMPPCMLLDTNQLYVFSVSFCNLYLGYVTFYRLLKCGTNSTHDLLDGVESEEYCMWPTNAWYFC